MIVLNETNVLTALPAGLRMLATRGVDEHSRNGRVIVAPEPVTTVYANPRERVLLSPSRDANPFFHLCEALWMLSGRNDVAFPAFFAKRLRSYSDDGVTLHAAYGRRWRAHFGLDQIDSVVAELRARPDSRRAVIAMWDPKVDSGRDGLDLPCNVTVHFQHRWLDLKERLDMTVFQRSGDAVWGVHGANAVHFSMLMEYVACRLGWSVGTYTHVTSNYHSYLNVFEKLFPAMKAEPFWGAERRWIGNPSPTLLAGPSDGLDLIFRKDLDDFCSWKGLKDIVSPFLTRVALPMRDAFAAWKQHQSCCGRGGAAALALNLLEAAKDCDWKLAGQEWLQRRAANAGALPSTEPEDACPVNTEHANDR